MREAVVGAVGM